MRTFVLLACSLLPLGQAGELRAQPLLLHHEGLLLDADGLPLEGEVTLRLALYDRAVGGAAMWSEEVQLELIDGYYSLQLGAQSSLAGLFDGSARYLGISVNLGEELVPRHPLASVPFALVADNAVGDITPNSISVGGVEVIDSAGHWVGPGAVDDHTQELEDLRSMVTTLQAQVAQLEEAGCGCEAGEPGTAEQPAASCLRLKQLRPQTPSGTYYINPFVNRPLETRRTYCEMTANGGGWTLAAVIRSGSFCHIATPAVGDVLSPDQVSCAKLSDEVVRALYTDQFWLSCGITSPERFGRIDNIANFVTEVQTGGGEVWTWSMTYGGATYSGSDHACCNIGDHPYHAPHIIYSIATGYNGGNIAAYPGCYNNNHGWGQNGFLYVR